MQNDIDPMHTFETIGLTTLTFKMDENTFYFAHNFVA